MGTRAAVRAACLAGIALTTNVVIAAPLAAQSEAAVDYELPAQDLDERLRTIARLSGREIIFSAETVEGRRASPLRGRFTADEAIRSALSGSGLVAEYRAGAVLIRERPAEASQPPPPAPEDSAIVVTGTRIRGASSASPVIVTTREELEEAGITDLAGYTRILPQNFTGGQNPGVAGQPGLQVNLNNSATLNLRGLGPDATLTLVNGHRIAYDALNQGIDIAAIPLGAIERIEVIPDGSSALYGSDAVGGVANIILRRPFDGLETTARVGASTEGGNVQQQYSAVGGGRWSSGGIVVALDHSRATPIFADDRDYTRTLDPTLTLTLKSSQWSGVISGQQRLTGGVSLEFDGLVMRRQSRKQAPFRTNGGVFNNGLVTTPEVDSYALTPTLRFDLTSGWQAALSATRAGSRTQLLSRRFANQVESRSSLRYENRTSGIEATAEGPLFAAPGGDVRLAIGGGVRKDLLEIEIIDFIGGSAITFRDVAQPRKVQFAYGELSLPLIGPDLSMPLVERLSLSGAVRYERYEGIEEVATPKFGIIYQPIPDLTLRATWGRSFKIPTLNQLNQPLQGALIPSRFFVQPQPPLAPGASVLLLGGGNPGLRSERATTWSATLEFRPRFLDGLHLQASYFNINFRDRIGSPLSGTLAALANPLFRDLITFNPSVDQVNALVASLPQGLLNQTGEPFNPANVGAIIDGAPRNTAREHIRGVDLAADYRLELGAGSRLLLTGAASYLESDQQLSPTQPVFERAGIIFNPPHWRGRFGGTWQGQRAGVSAFLNYVGGTRDNRFPVVERIGSFVTLDMSASFRTAAEAGPLRGVEVRLSALNLLNEEPDIIRNSLPEAPNYDSTNQSAVGRFISLTVRKTW